MNEEYRHYEPTFASRPFWIKGRGAVIAARAAQSREANRQRSTFERLRNWCESNILFWTPKEKNVPCSNSR